MSDMFELKAIELIAATPEKRRRRRQRPRRPAAGMAEAQYIAGMGFSNVGLGIVHSMAHPLGAFYDTPHGVANATVAALRHGVQRRVAVACKIPRYRPRHGRRRPTGMSVDEGVRAAVDAVKALSLSIRIPQRLHELGVRGGGYSGAGGGCVQRCLHGRQSRVRRPSRRSNGCTISPI